MGNENAAVLKLEERLDAVSVKDFKSKVMAYLQQNSNGVIVDFEKTKFIDSAGLGALVSILKFCANDKNKKLVLLSLSPAVKQIFELTRLYRLFDICETHDEANAVFAKE